MAAQANRCPTCDTGGQDQDGIECYSCRCREEIREYERRLRTNKKPSSDKKDDNKK